VNSHFGLFWNIHFCQKLTQQMTKRPPNPLSKLHKMLVRHIRGHSHTPLAHISFVNKKNPAGPKFQVPTHMVPFMLKWVSLRLVYTFVNQDSFRAHVLLACPWCKHDDYDKHVGRASWVLLVIIRAWVHGRAAEKAVINWNSNGYY